MTRPSTLTGNCLLDWIILNPWFWLAVAVGAVVWAVIAVQR